jgi:hypothetical protein
MRNRYDVFMMLLGIRQLSTQLLNLCLSSYNHKIAVLPNIMSVFKSQELRRIKGSYRPTELVLLEGHSTITTYIAD